MPRTGLWQTQDNSRDLTAALATRKNDPEIGKCNARPAAARGFAAHSRQGPTCPASRGSQLFSNPHVPIGIAAGTCGGRKPPVADRDRVLKVDRLGTAPDASAFYGRSEPPVRRLTMAVQ